MHHTNASSAEKRLLGTVWLGVWGLLAAGALDGWLLHDLGRRIR